MSELLDPPISLRTLTRISVEDFHRIADLGIYGKRAVLLRGIVTEKPAMSPLHRTLTLRLYDLFKSRADDGLRCFHESPITLRDSEPMPDVMIAKGGPDDFRDRHPATAELVIEVAVSSEALDRGMAALYAEAGVREYWIVLAVRRQVEVYRQPQGSDYRERTLYSGDEEIVCSALPAIRVPLPELFA